MDIGDKVVLVSHEHEGALVGGIPIGTVGIVASPPRQGNIPPFSGDFVDVDFGGKTRNPWGKNLRPAKEYYIKRFKEAYEGVK